MKFKEWSMKWLNIYKFNHISKKTYNIYYDVIINHLAPFLGEEQLNNINYELIEKYILNKKEELSNTTINLHLSIIKNIIFDAANNNIIDNYKLYKIKMLKKSKDNLNFFSIKDQYLIEDYCLKSVKDYYSIGIILTLYTGLRIGELISLTWDDVDLNNGYLRVNKTESRIKDNNKWLNIISSPKSVKSNRIIPIGKEIINILKKLKNKKYGNYIVSYKNGNKMLIRTYQHYFKSIQMKIGLNNILCFHSLRHTFATRAIESGVDIKTLSEILGHSNASITLNIYVHSLFETKKKAMDKISKLILNHSV